MNVKTIGLLLVIAAVCFSQKTRAATVVVPMGQITYVENGWYGEGMAIHTSNDGPSGCSAGPNQFAIDRNHPAYQELTAMALMAYMKNIEIGLVADSGTCILNGRTKIISIRLQK